MINVQDIFKRNPHKEIRGVYIFTEQDKYVESFSLQWDIHKKTQLQHTGIVDSDTIFFEKTGLSKTELKNKLVLDAGCGAGRFIDTVQRYGGDVVGCDLSESVFSAKENCPTATIAQVDIYDLPFKEEIFDIIFSIGVLHHTPDPKKAFKSLLPFLKKGGKICIWVYHDNPDVYNDESYVFLRRIFQILPTNLQYEVCKSLAPVIRDDLLYGKNELGIPENIRNALMHCVNMNPNDEQSILDTFDWNSCKYQWKFTWEEVEKWFSECGLKYKKLVQPISIQGER